MPELSTLLQDLADDWVQDRAHRRAGAGVGVDDVRHRVSTRRRRRERRRLMGVAAALMVIVGAAVLVAARRDDSSHVAAVAPPASGAPSAPAAPAPTSARGRELQRALDGRTFLARSATENGVVVPMPDTSYFELSFSGNVLLANGGCLEPGPFRIVDTTLVAILRQFPGASCGASARSSWYGELVSNNPTLSFYGEQLTLTAGAVQIQFVDHRHVDPFLRWDYLSSERMIVWEIGGGVPPAGTPPLGERAVLGLNIQNRDFLTLGTGCTEAQVTYTFDGRELSIGSIWLAPRLKECAPELEAAEREIVAVFSGRVRVGFDDLTVSFTKDSHVIRYRVCQFRAGFPPSSDRRCY